jgi:hypothetical protein
LSGYGISAHSARPPSSAPSADDWLVISDRSPEPALPDLIGRGLFVVEFTLPLRERAVLLDFAADDGWERGLTLFHEPGAGLILRHRQGGALSRHTLPGPLPDLQGTARLSLRFDAPARRWEMRLDLPEAPDHPALRSSGANPLPLRPGDVAALSELPARLRRHGAVLWFGLAQGHDLPVQAPWIGLRTPVLTDRGPVPAGRLEPGDLVVTGDDGLLPLIATRNFALPACGSFSPVLLRAPFLPRRNDLLVSSDLPVLMSGPEVEYLFGTEEVLVPAAALVDGHRVLAEHRRVIAPSVALLFDRPALIRADGCSLLAALPGDAPPRRLLESYETMMLMTQLGRGHPMRRA